MRMKKKKNYSFAYMPEIRCARCKTSSQTELMHTHKKQIQTHSAETRYDKRLNNEQHICTVNLAMQSIFHQIVLISRSTQSNAFSSFNNLN